MPPRDTPPPTLEYAFDVEVRLGPMEDHGQTRRGHRRVIPIVGGDVRGGITAEILPGGADWQIVRPDGTVELDARYTARTAEGAFVLIHAAGVRSGDPDVLAAILRGEPVDPTEYYFRTVLTLETAHRQLAHLEQSVFVASAIRTADRVRLCRVPGHVTGREAAATTGARAARGDRGGATLDPLDAAQPLRLLV